MIFCYIITIFTITFYTTIGCANTQFEDEIRFLEKRMYELQIDIKNTNKVLRELKKFLVIAKIRQNVNRGSFLSLNNDKSYYQAREKYEFYMFLYQTLERKIKEKQGKINELKDEYEKNLKKLREIKAKYAETMINKEETFKVSAKVSASKVVSKDSIMDPISGESSLPGKYKKRLSPGLSIKAPHSGIVKKIKFTTDTFAITIEGPKCNSTLVGISVLRVNIGEEVKTGQILGESGFSEEENNLIYEINCAK